jgi:hypothetical protein
MRPQIATILDDGTYGQREMNDDEFTEWQAIAAQYPPAEEAPTE